MRFELAASGVDNGAGIVAAIVAIGFAVRNLSSRGGEAGSINLDPWLAPVGARLMWSFLLLLTYGMSGAFRVIPKAAWMSGVYWGGGLALIWLPGLLLNTILVPLGFSRIAAIYARMMKPYPICHDPVGGAALYSALAASRGTFRPSPDRVARMREQLEFNLKPSGLAVLADALLADLAGDSVRARQLFGVAVAPDRPRILSRFGRRIGREWLVADRLASNDLHGARALAATPGWCAWPDFVRISIDFRLGDRDRRFHSRILIVLLWLAAPYRLASWRWLRRTLGTPALPPVNAVDPGPTDTGQTGARVQALGRHRDVLMTTDAMAIADRLPAACRGWDLAGDPDEAATRALSRHVHAFCSVLPHLPNGPTGDLLCAELQSSALAAVEDALVVLETTEPWQWSPRGLWVAWRECDSHIHRVLTRHPEALFTLSDLARRILNRAVAFQTDRGQHTRVAQAMWLRTAQIAGLVGDESLETLARSNIRVTD